MKACILHMNDNDNRIFSYGVFNLSSIDTLGQMGSAGERAVLCLAGWLAAPLTSTSKVPVAPRPQPVTPKMSPDVAALFWGIKSLQNENHCIL